MSRALAVFRNSFALCKLGPKIEVNGNVYEVDDVPFVDDVSVLIVDDANGITDRVLL